jgi:hypothetical protein
MLLSAVALGFSFQWSNQFCGSLCSASSLSLEELRRMSIASLITFGAAEPGLIRSEASQAKP